MLIFFKSSVYLWFSLFNVARTLGSQPSYVVVNQGPKQVIRTKLANLEGVDPNVEAVLKKHMNSIKKLTEEFPDREIEVQLDLQKPKKQPQLMVMQRNEASARSLSSYTNVPSYISVPGYTNLQNVQNYANLQSMPRNYPSVRNLNSYSRIQVAPNYEPVNYMYEPPVYDRNAFIPSYESQYRPHYRRMDIESDYVPMRKRKSDVKSRRNYWRNGQETTEKETKEKTEDNSDKKPVTMEDLKKALGDLEKRLSSKKQGTSVQQAKVKQLIDLLKQAGGSVSLWRNVKKCLTTEMQMDEIELNDNPVVNTPQSNIPNYNETEIKNLNLIDIKNFHCPYHSQNKSLTNYEVKSNPCEIEKENSSSQIKILMDYLYKHTTPNMPDILRTQNKDIEDFKEPNESTLSIETEKDQFSQTVTSSIESLDLNQNSLESESAEDFYNVLKFIGRHTNSQFEFVDKNNLDVSQKPSLISLDNPALKVKHPKKKYLKSFDKQQTPSKFLNYLLSQYDELLKRKTPSRKLREKGIILTFKDNLDINNLNNIRSIMGPEEPNMIDFKKKKHLLQENKLKFRAKQYRNIVTKKLLLSLLPEIATLNHEQYINFIYGTLDLLHDVKYKEVQ